MTTMAITTGFLAPSNYLGRVIAKQIKESLPKNNGSEYQVKMTFQNSFEFNDRKFGTNALDTNKACAFVAQIVEGERKRDYYEHPILGSNPNDKLLFYPIKGYQLKGWVEIDWDVTKKIDVFYEVMGNVMRDPKTAVAMLLL